MQLLRKIVPGILDEFVEISTRDLFHYLAAAHELSIGSDGPDMDPVCYTGPIWNMGDTRPIKARQDRLRAQMRWLERLWLY